MTKNAKRLLPFVILLILIIIVYIADVYTFLNFDWLRDQHLRLKGFVNAYPVASPLIFIGFYIFSVCLVIPDSTILTILGGLVFPLPLAIIYAVISEGIGTMIFYRIVCLVFRVPGLEVDRPFIHKIRKELGRNPASYMLFLRVSHVVPFWTTNVIASYFKVKPWTLAWTTFLGVIPLTYILAEAGHSLSGELSKKVNLTVSDIFTLQVKLALLAIGIIILVPIIYKNFIRRNGRP